MALLDDIKKGRKTEREKFVPSTFDRLAFILENSGFGELIRGTRVKIRRDSKYARDTTSIGILQENYSDGGSSEEHKLVTFDDGSREKYRKKDLEICAGMGSMEGLKLEKEAYLAEKEKELLEARAETSSKKRIEDAPPFHPVSFENAKLIDQLVQYENPYFKFVASADEVLPAHFLWQINPNLSEALLSGRHLGTVLYSEIAKPIAAKLESRKKTLEDHLVEIKSKRFQAAFKKIASKFDIENAPRNEGEVKNFLKALTQQIKPAYVANKIKSAFNIEVSPKDLEGAKEKLLGELLKKGAVEGYIKIRKENVKLGDYIKYKTKSDSDRTVEGKVTSRCENGFHLNEGSHYNPVGEILKRATNGGYIVEEYAETLGIKSRDLLVTKTLGKEALEKLVSKKLSQYLDSLEASQEATEKKITKFAPELVGRKVKIYPGGKETGYNYDAGGDTDQMPAGTEGEISMNRGDLLSAVIRTSRASWTVTPREIRLLGKCNSLVEFLQEEYGFSTKAAEGIFNGDYKTIVDEFAKDETASTDKEIADIGNKLSYLNKFILGTGAAAAAGNGIEGKLGVGSRVIMGPRGNEEYAITKEGSIGKITSLVGETAYVSWEKLTGRSGSDYIGRTYEVHLEHLKPYKEK